MVPGGSGSVVVSNDQYVGSLAYLLPQLEQQNVYDRIKVDLRVDQRAAPWWTETSTWTVAQARLAVFICPTAEERPNVGTYVLMHEFFKPSTSEVWLFGGYFDNASGADKLGPTNYVGVAGQFGVTGISMDKYRGLFTNRSRNNRGHCRDGMSNTLLFGEGTGFMTNNRLDIAYSWMGVGALPTHFGIGAPTWEKFSSRHAGVVTFALGDGSVRPIANTIDAGVLRSISGMVDGDSMLVP
jgi:hypothetical protein